MKTSYQTIFLLLFFTHISFAQVNNDDPEPDEIIKVKKEPQPMNMDSIKRLIGYPQMARDQGVEGSVVLRVLVGKTGKYEQHILINKVSPLLASACEAHISKLNFSPAIDLDGNPVKYWVNIPFNFKLLGGDPIPKNVLNSGFDNYRKGNYKNALNDFEWVIMDNKKNLIAYLMKGASRFKLDHPWATSDFQRSLKLLEKLAKKNPSYFTENKEEMAKPYMTIKGIREECKDERLNEVLDQITARIVELGQN